MKLSDVNDRPVQQREFMARVMTDPAIPSGSAVAVALAIACRIRWSYPVSVIPVRAIAGRLNLEQSYVEDVIALLCLTGYLRNTGAVRNQRKLYTATMPPERVAA